MIISPEKQADIRQIISSAIKNKTVIGTSIAIVEKDNILYSQSYGTRKFGTNMACNDETLFPIGSISKSFTSLAILILEEDEKLSIEDSLSKYLPEIDLQGKEHKIKIKHLMSHSSGLPNIDLAVIIEKNLGIRSDYNNLDFNFKIENWEDLYAYINAHSDYITTKPEERFHYSDTAFSLLGVIIERISGQKYHEFLKKWIFNPLEMYRTSIRSIFEEDENCTHGHVINQTGAEKNIVATFPNYPISYLLDGGGGILSCNADMSNYLLMMINRGSFNGKQIFSDAIYVKLTMPCIKVHQEHSSILESATRYYGFGWAIVDNFLQTSNRFILHPGNTGASTALIGFFPEKKIGLLFLNNINSNPFLTSFNILASILDNNAAASQPGIIKYYKNIIGTFISPGIKASITIENKDGTLYFYTTDIHVGAVDNISKALHPFNTKYTSDSLNFFVNFGNSRIGVYFEENNNYMWLTFAGRKYKKIDNHET